MADNIVIESAPEVLDSDSLRSKLNTDGCGSIVSFLGITRDFDDGEKVIALEFDAWQDKLEPTLYDLAKLAIEKFGVDNISIYKSKFKPMGQALPKRGSPCLLKLIVNSIM